ncbi:hypothetical protein M0802_004354 [Mischocyttarus mexicanus]|nr:hypothetical protein M0802_004354 [Mischocyttarus mexicanus]
MPCNDDESVRRPVGRSQQKLDDETRNRKEEKEKTKSQKKRTVRQKEKERIKEKTTQQTSCFIFPQPNIVSLSSKGVEEEKVEEGWIEGGGGGGGAEGG